MAAEFDTLFNPSVLSVELAVLIIGFLGVTLYAAMRIRSPMTMIFWLLAVVSLILKILVDLTLAVFWAALMLEVTVLVISMLVFTFFKSRI